VYRPALKSADRQVRASVERSDLTGYFLPVRRGRVLARVELHVTVDQLRILLLEPSHEVIARAAFEEQHVASDELSTVIRDRLHRALEQRRLGGDAWDDRIHQHAGTDAGIYELAHGAESLHRMRRARLELTPGIFVHARHTDAHVAVSACGDVLQHIFVPDDHRPFGDDARRIATRAQRFQ